MGLISHDWSDIQNLCLKSLSDKISSQRDILSLIKNNGIRHETYGTTGTTPFIQLTVPQKQRFLPELTQEMSTTFKEELQALLADATLYLKQTSTLYYPVQSTKAFTGCPPPLAPRNSLNTGLQ